MIAPPSFVRQCTEIETFVGTHGVDDYKRAFRPNATIDELLQDERVARGNQYYEENHGSGVTDEHRCAYIAQWGVAQYRDWFERDSDYLTIVANPKFAEAQQIFLDKTIPEVEPGIRSAQYVEDPFHRGMRDIKGVAIPEPPIDVGKEDYDDTTYELYIQDNGILNYMLLVNSRLPLETLLHYPNVAFWQRSYIRKLDYDDKIEMNL
jgi:hypothetical protein